MNSDEIRRREQQLQDQRLEEPRLQDQRLQEQQLQAQQLRDQQLREQQLRDQQLRDQQPQDQQLQERQLQQQRLQEQRLQEQQFREQRLQEERVREQRLPEETQSPLNQNQTKEKISGPVLVLNENGNVRFKEQETKVLQSQPKEQQEAQQQQLSKIEKAEEKAKEPGRDSQNRTKELEEWLNKAKEINRPEEYQERIKATIKSHEQGKKLSLAVDNTIQLDQSLAEQNYRVIKPGDLERWEGAATANGNSENQELVKQIREEKDRKLVSNAVLVSKDEFGKYQNDLEVYKQQNPQEVEQKGNPLVEKGQSGTSRGFDSIAHLNAELHANPALGRNLMDGADMRIHEQLYNFKEQEQALDKHLQDFPADWQRQQELDKLTNKIGSYERVTNRIQEWRQDLGAKEISVDNLKQWKQEAEALHLAGTRGKEHLERIEVIERRAEVKGKESTHLLDAEYKNLQQDHRDFQVFNQKAEQLQGKSQEAEQLQGKSQDRSTVPDSLRKKVEAQREKYSTTERQSGKSQEKSQAIEW